MVIGIFPKEYSFFNESGSRPVTGLPLIMKYAKVALTLQEAYYLEVLSNINPSSLHQSMKRISEEVQANSNCSSLKRRSQIPGDSYSKSKRY